MSGLRLQEIGSDIGQSIVPQAIPVRVLAILQEIAVIVIGSLAVSGVLGGIATGATVIGFSLFEIAVNRIGEEPNKKWGKCRIINNLGWAAILGTLAMTGVITPALTGWIMLGKVVVLGACLVSCAPYLCCGFALSRNGAFGR